MAISPPTWSVPERLDLAQIADELIGARGDAGTSVGTDAAPTLLDRVATRA